MTQMGDYDYRCYALQKTGVTPFGHAPFYNSSTLWSFNPSMRSSPTSSVIMTPAVAAPRRHAMSDGGTSFGLHRSGTQLTTRSMPQESDNHSAPWYQKTKHALSGIPAMFEARANKENSRVLERYNNWQPKDIEPNPTGQYLSLPAKPISFFQASRQQAANDSAPGKSTFYKHHSADVLSQRHDPSASSSSASAFSSDGRSADSHSANSRVALKASTPKNTPGKVAQTSGPQHVTPRSVADLSSPVRGNAETSRPVAESSFPRSVLDPSVVPKSGLYLKHTTPPSRPTENALGRRPYVDSSSSTVKDPSHSSFPSPSPETDSKDYGAQPQGKIKFNPLFENDIKDHVRSKLPSVVAGSPRPEVGLNRHLAGQRIPTDGVRGASQPKAKVNEKSTSSFDEKQIIKDAFRFLDDFDD